MIMLLRNEENIREVIPFPMSGTAQDLMCGAPNEVTEQQLREVHIKVRGLMEKIHKPKIFFHTGFAREGANLSDMIERMICYG